MNLGLCSNLSQSPEEEAERRMRGQTSKSRPRVADGSGSERLLEEILCRVVLRVASKPERTREQGA